MLSIQSENFYLYEKLTHSQNLKSSLKYGASEIFKECFFRFFYVCLSLFLSSGCTWIYSTEILFFYLSPLLNFSKTIIFTSLSEAFYTTIYLSLITALLCTLPLVLYVICCFWKSCCFPDEQHLSTNLCWAGLCFYLLSLCISHQFIIPELCTLFLKFSVSDNFFSLSLQARISSYISWSLNIYVWSLIFFEIPLFYLCLSYKENWFSNKLNTQNAAKQKTGLHSSRLFTFSFLLLFCAFISPPDVLIQETLFFFLLIGYEFVVWLTFLQKSVYDKKKIGLLA